MVEEDDSSTLELSAVRAFHQLSHYLTRFDTRVELILYDIDTSPSRPPSISQSYHISLGEGDRLGEVGGGCRPASLVFISATTP